MLTSTLLLSALFLILLLGYFLVKVVKNKKQEIDDREKKNINGRSIASKQELSTPDQQYIEYDFVAMADEFNRICVSGKKDDFKATRINGIWEIGYPEFDDLMDNFCEVKEFSEINRYSTEARNHIAILLEVESSVS